MTSLTIGTGDIADDKYFRKANDSDATQFALLYPQLGAHGGSISYLSLHFPSHLIWFPSFAVWALLWIMFEVAILTGFVLLGVACFKYDPEDMAAKAGV